MDSGCISSFLEFHRRGIKVSDWFLALDPNSNPHWLASCEVWKEKTQKKGEGVLIPLQVLLLDYGIVSTHLLIPSFIQSTNLYEMPSKYQALF